MIYMDLEEIYKKRNIPNKYILTLVISARARQLSERRDVYCNDKYISKAVEDVTNGKVNYKIINPVQRSDNEPTA
ncbi:MAG: DNA-directed RNA polymerase subunit omega [Synergistes sp.]|nr:DNA-directed RNA polymerase subunit omega [Synergistes sp.]